MDRGNVGRRNKAARQRGAEIRTEIAMQLLIAVDAPSDNAARCNTTTTIDFNEHAYMINYCRRYSRSRIPIKFREMYFINSQYVHSISNRLFHIDIKFRHYFSFDCYTIFNVAETVKLYARNCFINICVFNYIFYLRSTSSQSSWTSSSVLLLVNMCRMSRSTITSFKYRFSSRCGEKRICTYVLTYSKLTAGKKLPACARPTHVNLRLFTHLSRHALWHYAYFIKSDFMLDVQLAIYLLIWGRLFLYNGNTLECWAIFYIATQRALS